jgi:hypothetical protein
MQYAIFEKVRDSWCLMWTYPTLAEADKDLTFYRDVLRMNVCIMGRNAKRVP